MPAAICDQGWQASAYADHIAAGMWKDDNLAGSGAADIGWEQLLQRMNVGVVDERSELAACYMGIPQNDVGLRTDILDGCPKAEGMLMLLRSMSPKVIAVDEIGSREDIDAISYVINCGCGILATIHGDSIDDIRTRPVLRKLVEEKVFERYIVLGRSAGIGTVESIFDERGNELYIGSLSVAN